MAVRRLVKAVEKNFFRERVLSKNGLRIAPRALVKALETFLFSENEYFPKMVLELRFWS